MLHPMAILANCTLEDAAGLRDFGDWVLGTHNATHDILQAHAQQVSPTEAKKFHEAHQAYQQAILKKRDHVLRNGCTNPDIETIVNNTQKAYKLLQNSYGTDPALAFLNDPIHRKEFAVEPYTVQTAGKRLPPHPYLGATSAMDGLWPGYDKPEYFEHFPFLHTYADRMPGKALQAFLREHRLYFHFPETVSRYGVLFVPPPYLDDDVNVELRQHLSTCDSLFHTAPKLSLTTRVEEASLVLSYVEDDMVAVVEDEGGRCVGVVGWQDLQGVPAGTLVSSLYTKEWNEAPEGVFDAKGAFSYMEKRDWPYMLRFTEFGPRIVTQTTAAISSFLPPHTYKNGLGSSLYFGISDVAEGDALIHRLQAEADGLPAAFVETAHADTQYYRTIFRHYREKLQDVFLMAGTTVDPEAVLDFLDTYGADGVKLGIAEGRACRTSNTGVAPPNAHVGLECGAVAMDRGYLLLDGWGGSDEFIKGLAMSGIQMRQGGGAFVGRREAANPSVIINGVRGKFYRGMAGADVQQSVAGRKSSSLSKRMESRAHLHSEGAEVFVPQRTPSTVGRMLLSHMFLLKSAMSYQGVRAERANSLIVPKALVEPALRQFQRHAKLYAVALGSK